MAHLKDHHGRQADPGAAAACARSRSIRRTVRTATLALAIVLSVAPAYPFSPMSCLVMRGGKVLTMIDGKPAAPISTETTMSNGTRVETDGTVKPNNGNEFRLGEGDMIMMDGHIMRGGKPKAMQP